jgi:hypothetical protein
LAAVYASLATELEDADAWLVQERVFSHEDLRPHTAFLGDRADGAPSTWLTPLDDSQDDAVLVHAVVGN